MKLALLILCTCFFSCSGNYSGFKEHSPGFHYKLVGYEHESTSIDDGSHLLVAFCYCENSDCDKKSDQHLKHLFIEKDEKNRLFFHAKQIGDRYITLLDSNIDQYWIDFYSLDKKYVVWPVICEVELIAQTNKDKFEGNVAFKDSLMFLREQFEISRFLKNESVAYEFKNGSHIHITKEGNGKSIEDGLEVTLSYKAYFTSGIKFDDTNEWKDTLKFIYGVPFQIILGLEISLEGLKSGTEAKLIIPSQLAFGKDGSSSGIVPPFEPIIYEIKILSVIELES